MATVLLTLDWMTVARPARSPLPRPAGPRHWPLLYAATQIDPGVVLVEQLPLSPLSPPTHPPSEFEVPVFPPPFGSFLNRSGCVFLRCRANAIARTWTACVESTLQRQSFGPAQPCPAPGTRRAGLPNYPDSHPPLSTCRSLPSPVQVQKPRRKKYNRQWVAASTCCRGRAHRRGC